MSVQQFEWAVAVPGTYALASPQRQSLTSRGILPAIHSASVKRFFDLSVASVLLVLFTPLFLLVAVLIKLTDGGPVLFVQRRAGLNGKLFNFYKFRSMVLNAPALRHQLVGQNHHGSSITFKIKKDPRVTWIGRIIRKLSIDELPQLWNILEGNMSLVGPRPPIPEEVARYKPEDFKRLSVLPGITCIWQVTGRANLPFEEQVKLDIQYIRERTFWLDLWLLLVTIPAVISCRGAY